MFSDVFNKNLHLSSKAGEIFPWASRVNLMQTTTKPLECFLWCYVDFRIFKAGYYVWYLPKMMPISHEKSRRNRGSFYVEHSLEPSSLGRKTSRSFIKRYSSVECRWWFQVYVLFTPTWGNDSDNLQSFQVFSSI